MIHEKNDFVLLQDASVKKPVLVEIIKLTNTGYRGVLSMEERAYEGDQRFEVDFSQEDILLNLGPNPPLGQKVCGVSIDPYLGKFKIKSFSFEVALLDALHENDIKSIQSDGLKFAKQVRSLNGFNTNIRRWRLVVRPATGLKVGEWKILKDGTETVTLFTGGKVTPDWFYVFSHEYGHHIWELCLTEKERARWMRLYRKGMSINEISKAEITKYRNVLENSETVKEARKSFEDPDEVKKFNLVLSASLKLSNSKARDFETLIAGGDSLMDYWITTPLATVDRTIMITEYARKNATELFCECVAYFLTGIEMPKLLKNKTEITLTKAIERGPSITA